MHYFCHRLIHYNVPWSLTVFQQRNGRVDRYGQSRRPEIYYLSTESAVERIKGDARVLELLIQKDKEVVESIGDPSEFTRCFDVESEEAQVAEAMSAAAENPTAFDEFAEALNPDEDDFFSFLNEPQEPVASANVETTRKTPSLFASDKTPTQRLTALRREFFAVRSELENRTSRSRRWEATADFVGELLVALGYAGDRSDAPIRETNGGKTLPLRAEVRRPDGSPWLWALEVVDEADGEGDPLRQKPFVEQYPATVDPKKRLDEVEFETIVTREIFGLGEETPRWVLLVRYDRIVLIDRTKWIDKRSLQFDLLEIFDRREPTTLAATAALLSRESLCPNSGAPILDEWEEKSRQHAVSVSNDLKYAAREAVELLGNEAARWMRENGRGVYNRNLADKLTQERFIYLYRLLFAFYVESRSEKLGYVPMKADAYRFGY